MAIQRHAPDYNQAFVFTADEAITAKAVVVQGAANNSIKMPGAAKAPQIIGVADNAIASAATGRILTAGIVECIAAAAITRGDRVCIHGTTGKVRTYVQTTDAGAEIVGTALASVTTDLDTVPVLLSGRGVIGT
jgi:hypothetical protein